MAIIVSDLKRWLNTLANDSEVAIDEGGLTLVEVDGEAYLEVGGETEEEEV